MSKLPPDERATPRETLIFLAKLVGYLFGLFVVAFIIFTLTKSLHIPPMHR